ncbi:proteasome subunit beta type-2-like isoform X2 [Drosophila hydei]|uniref:Proteasome subunit beta n=1 Tax=Drosophila hydei TaxID=7224 RepID=A0A6J1ME18_DROHY|nr:proteasome subunit beta type-2-like isoform X2 [Drosophila hydei]
MAALTMRIFCEFDFSNAELKRRGWEPPTPITTGTTVVGLHFSGGVMIGTDTRATRLNMISSNTSLKIRRLHSNIYCGGSGYASDLVNLTRLLELQMEMHYKSTNKRRVPVVCAKQLTKALLMRYMGRMMISFVLGGVDRSGVHLYSVHFDGTTEMCLYNSIGTGQYGAMGILEDRWKLGLSEDEARELIVDAVSAGINNDLISGSSVDLVVIRNDFSVEKCNEIIHTPLRPDPFPVLTQKIDYKKLLNEVQILEESIMELNQVVPKPIGRKRVKKPVRRDEVRTTLGCILMNRKRSADFDKDEPPKKKRKTWIDA